MYAKHHDLEVSNSLELRGCGLSYLDGTINASWQDIYLPKEASRIWLSGTWSLP